MADATKDILAALSALQINLGTIRLIGGPQEWRFPTREAMEAAGGRLMQETCAGVNGRAVSECHGNTISATREPGPLAKIQAARRSLLAAGFDLPDLWLTVKLQGGWRRTRENSGEWVVRYSGANIDDVDVVRSQVFAAVMRAEAGQEPLRGAEKCVETAAGPETALEVAARALPAGEPSKSKKKRGRKRRNTRARDKSLEEEYSRLLHLGAISNQTEFAARKNMERSTMAKALARGLAAREQDGEV